MSFDDEHDPTVCDSQFFPYNAKRSFPDFIAFNSPTGATNIDLSSPNLTTEKEDHGRLIATLHFTNGLSQDSTEINVFAGQEIRVGREEDPNSCQFIIADFRVSKKQFRIYSIIYEQTDLDDIQPLIYCEDLESTNGTYINNECIGMAGFDKRGHLLTDGDIIEIKPHWKYLFRQVQKHNAKLKDNDDLELGDIKHFSDRFIVTDRLLGAGQYGKVYLAREVITSRQVACKIINLKKADDDAMESSGTWSERCRRAKQERDRLLREVLVLAQLSHPHVMDLKKAYCSNNFIYMFTEIALAGDLFSYCDAHGGQLSDVEGRVICRQIALALEYMHEKQVAHRDIKKENILVMQTYDFSCRVVLTDFGFANHLDPRTRRMMSKVGTDGYAAPEVEAADQSSIGYTLAVDMYSLGVLTLNMLHGNTLLPRDLYSQQSQENVERFVGGMQLEGLTYRAKKFLRGLLDRDPTKRMNVKQVLQHSWFKKPQGETAAIEEAFKRITAHWKPRQDFDTIVEIIPNRSGSQPEQPSNPGKKNRRRIPDVNPYPFIGLDSRLNPRPQSSRGLVLNDLKEKGSFFVAEGTDEPNMAPKIQPRTRIRSVLGADMFESNAGRSLLDQDDSNDYDDLSPVSTSMSEYQLSGSFETGNVRSKKLKLSKNPESEQIPRVQSRRYETQSIHPRLSLAERIVHEGLAKTIPRHGNAKTYGEAARKSMGLENSA